MQRSYNKPLPNYRRHIPGKIRQLEERHIPGKTRQLEERQIASTKINWR
jgi:hypothetical protein